ncbi:hypothetical protein [Roseibium alexandrii]|uniref:Uncharacterized protein n=1 Tax=Roseibium alexandrii (strain DSM 17067 / NCIMB 14079 / DFL-11) TaxID=244592 RepID=A0A5E8H6C9_ROSAD|nr:hypothetical protein [Roseibium alexandrii]EEE48071.2 hypothetical protein SADFL11_132 [Roseibium alexandrii DFL-11]
MPKVANWLVFHVAKAKLKGQTGWDTVGQQRADKMKPAQFFGPALTAAFLLSAGSATMAMSGFGTSDTTAACPPHRVTIENRSSGPIEIRQIMWLNSDETDWISQDVRPESVAPGGDWSGDISLTGLSGGKTFVKAQYQIQGKADTGTSELSSERAIPSCRTTQASVLRVVDKR